MLEVQFQTNFLILDKYLSYLTVLLKKRSTTFFPVPKTLINCVPWQMKVSTCAAERNQLGADRQTPLPGSVLEAIFKVKSRHDIGFVIR